VQDTAQLTIDDPRPVGKGVQELVSRYGYVITYEDAQLAYEGDLQDVTTQVRKDLDQYPAGKAPKVIVPLGGTITLTIPSSPSITPKALATVLTQLTQVQSSRGEGGHFRVEQTGDAFHVIPTEARDQNGNWAKQTSVLDVPISLPLQDRDQVEMLRAICSAVNAATHVKMGVGGLGRGIEIAGQPRLYRLGADNERAREVLMRALALINTPQKLTWLLFCEANTCALNIQGVPDRPSLPEPAASKTPVKAGKSGTDVN
jgi:hypothetical protein